MGGEYIVWFNQEGSEERKLLYRLETLGIIKLTSKVDKLNKIKSYKYQWELTNKGKALINENESLKKIWGNGQKVNVNEFYKETVKLLKN